MHSKVNTLIFDCFGVICGPVLNGWYQDYCAKEGFIDTNIDALFEKFDLGQITEDDIIDYFSLYSHIDSSKEVIQEQVDSYLVLNTELLATIQELKDEGYRIVLLTNANASFFERKLYPKYPDFKNIFDEIIISSEIGIVKPNTAIYRYALEKIGVDPEESLFVDDRKINVDSAIRIGMHGHIFTHTDSFKQFLSTL
jgi:epoxide hydrolase-like predicted phosphatase